MTGAELGVKGLKEMGRVAPRPFNKVYDEAARFQGKIAKQQKRTRRAVGITTQQPKMLEPTKPDPVPTFQEIQPMTKKRKSGRSSTILASRLNQRRNVLDFSSINTGKTLLK